MDRIIEISDTRKITTAGFSQGRFMEVKLIPIR